MTTLEDPTAAAVDGLDETVRAIAARVISRRPYLDIDAVTAKVRVELFARRNDRVQTYTTLLVERAVLSAFDPLRS